MIATRSPSVDARDAGADRDDVARELVPEDLRVLRAGERDAARRASRSGPRRTRAGPCRRCRTSRPGRRPRPSPGSGGSGDVLDSEVAGGVEAKRPHGYPASRSPCRVERAASRHDPLGSQAREEVGERRLGVANAEEAEPPAAPHVGERLDRASEICVRVPPRRQAARRAGRGDRGDARSRARPRRRRPSAARAAPARRRTATGSTPRAAASRGHIRRQRKTSPLTMLSAWFAAAGVVAAQTRWSASRPASVTSVTASHCSREPGKWNPRPVSRQIAAVDGERHPHVHRVAERPADQRVRTMHRPGEAVALGGREEHVLLDVVEVLVRQARLLLRERRVRLGLRVRLERPEVVLEPGDQRDVSDGPLAGDGVEQVPEHAPVDVAVLRLGRAARPRREEHVGRCGAAHRGRDRVGVLEIRAERCDPLVDVLAGRRQRPGPPNRRRAAVVRRCLR